MKFSRFQYSFADITEGLCAARVQSHHLGEETAIRAGIDDHLLARLSHSGMPAVIADMVDLALAVFVADRLSRPRAGECRRIDVLLPVRQPSIMSRPDVLESLQEMLFDYTGDDWSFSFTLRHGRARSPEREPALMTGSEDAGQAEVALWSGGLDALAGLYSRLHTGTHARAYTLFGTGGNTNIHKTQQRLARLVRKHFPLSNEQSIDLIRVPIRLAATGGLRKNAVPRARGFVFQLLGAACAALQGQPVLHIYEKALGR